MFLMPSQFEPCGLSQLISLRYGAVPIVRETGGLRDTVLSYNEYTGDGNGFSFFNYNAHDMLNTINRAIRFYHQDKAVWGRLMKRGMTGDYSWTNSAAKYTELYRALVGNDRAPASAEEAPSAVPETSPAAEPMVEIPTAEIPSAEPPAEPAPVKKPRTKKSAAP